MLPNQSLCFKRVGGYFSYQYKDHLGNNRLSYADSNKNGKIDTPYTSGVTVWQDGFEDKSTGDWESVGAMYGRKITGFDTTKAKNGAKSGYIKLNTYGKWTDYYVHSNEWIDININKPTLFRFSGWVFTEPEVYRAQFYFFMNKEGETNYNTQFDYVETREKGKWVYMEKTVMVPPEIKKLNFRIDADGYRNGTVWYDDLKIEQLDMSQNEIVSETNYYPFGLAHKGYNEHVKGSYLGENWKYQGQERTPEMDLNIDEWKYRVSDPAIGRFWQIDPLAESYVYNSTYAFQENKIGLGYELEGLELVYRKGTSPEFKQKYGSVVQYMNEKGTSGMMAKLNTLGRTELVDNTGEGSYYNREEKAIYFDPTTGIETDQGHKLSPATILNHEIDHALQDKENPEQMEKDLKTPDENMKNKEEARVVNGSEQVTAKKHGEIQKGEVTRTNRYEHTEMTTTNPTTMENATPKVTQLEEVIVKPRK